MRPMPLVLAAFIVLAGFVLADGPAEEPAPEERLHRLQQDRPLIETLVESGLRLANEEDALKRAETCSNLAAQLAQEIGQATNAKDGNRAADLGQYLQALLVRGVAANLSLAHNRIPTDSPRAPEVQRLGERVFKATEPAMEELGRPMDAEQELNMLAALQALSEARAEVRKAAKGPAPKGPGFGTIGKKGNNK